MRKFDLSLRSSRSSYFATFRHQLTILSKTDALDEEKWLNMLGTFVKDWFRYESHFVHCFFSSIRRHTRYIGDWSSDVCSSDLVHDPERMKTSVRRMLEHRVEGVAVMTFGMEESLLDDLKLRNVPLVFVDVGPARPRVSNIRIDYLHGIRQAVQHLAAMRHEKIAFITGPLGLKSALARKEVFVQSMSEIGMTADPELIIEGNHTLEGGEEAFAKLLSRRLRPTGILC